MFIKDDKEFNISTSNDILLNTTKKNSTEEEYKKDEKSPKNNLNKIVDINNKEFTKGD